MYLHANAKLGLAGRLALVRAVEDGMSLKQAAVCFSVSPATALAGGTGGSTRAKTRGGRLRVCLTARAGHLARRDSSRRSSPR